MALKLLTEAEFHAARKTLLAIDPERSWWTPESLPADLRAFAAEELGGFIDEPGVQLKLSDSFDRFVIRQVVRIN